MFSTRAVVTAVAVAFVAGTVVSLAIRPPGEVAASNETAIARGEPRVHWRMPLSATRNLPGSGEVPVWFSEQLLAASNGAFQIDLFDPGEIVPAFAITDAVRDRKVPVGWTWLGYDQGKIPSSSLIAATPFGMEPWAFIGWWFFAGGQELTHKIYAEHNMRPIFCAISGPETAVWFREPLTSAADLQGLKIRFAGLGGKVMQRVGASVTMLPAGEIFQALETGVIDATEYSQPITDEALGFARIAKYNYFPGWHQPFSATHMVVNVDEWNALAAHDQALVENTCTAAVAFSLGLLESLQGPVVRKFKETGVITSHLPDDMLRLLKRTTDEVLNEEAAGDAYFAEVLTSMRAYQEVYMEWRRLAYVDIDYDQP
jgi:TRAP-type mannitol/chloroaromatic compound transport system substrate-binding protein